MANNGPNRGRVLQSAVGRFAAMLIGESRDLSAFTYKELDDALHLPVGQAVRWSKYPTEVARSGKSRTGGPQAGGLQTLENNVASFLGRPRYRLFVENNGAIDENALLKSVALSELTCGMNLRHLNATDLQIGYEDGWPTYRQLQSANLLDEYRWQWRILCERNLLTSKDRSEEEEIIHMIFLEQKLYRSNLELLLSGRCFVGVSDIVHERLGTF